jgi:hypothetical protein
MNCVNALWFSFSVYYIHVLIFANALSATGSAKSPY